MLGPLVAGMAGTALPAFGHYPAAGAEGLSLAPFAALFDWPGIGAAVRLSLTTGLAATALALTGVALLLAGWGGTPVMRLAQRLLSPLLSVPHAAMAFGLAFLIAPSGWLVRLVSPWATGWTRPPDVLIVQDPWGLAMTAGLVAKEMPFLLLMALAALGQADAARRMRVTQALGYGRVRGWMVGVFPSVYAQIRLPVYVVLAYSMSVADVAMILGPSTPPPLSVQVVRWMADPDLSMRLVASAGALLQLGLVILGLGLWRLGEASVARLAARSIATGARGRREDAALRGLGLSAAFLSAGAVFGGIAGLAVWSVAGYWGFPDALPLSASWDNWMRHGAGIAESGATTLWIALASVAIALILTTLCLEAEHRRGRPLSRRGLWLLYMPLLVPQIAFLPGLQTLLLVLGLKGGLVPVILAHLVFVLPYVFLSLGDPWRAWETRYDTVGRALGASPWRVFATLRLPMLIRPLLTAAAVGAAVSVGQYLPTLLVGGGRVPTLTTEAVALASGGDRRAIGVYGVAQTVAVILPFALALAVPTLLWRNRRGLHV
ncbi:ABC transporter permease [Litorisediminicola beolgyonensis]|uniref:ABC transporter permease n=1 Tax=Litorisediminicola beolgyonensis TaxID=1173614 RepID=A0ABW3ZHP2_9RHOB